ncbi:MAG: DUF1735 domain-containing protein [Mediterranea sp.]|jgi:hypothetical protein|nr:DUF1735 domain-containing protein [Mediterranea sp.]
MKNRIKNIYLLFIALGVTGLFAACDENLHDFAKKTPADATHAVYIADLEFNYPVNRTANSQVIGLDTILAKFPVHSTLAVENDVTVRLTIDNELVDVYNIQHGTGYNRLPAYSITHSTVTIGKGQTRSADSITIAYPRPLPTLSDRNGYLLPVRIVSYGGTDVKINYEERVSYLIINVTQQNGVYFKVSSGKITNNPTLELFGDFNDITFEVSSLFDTEGETKVTLSVNNNLIQDLNSMIRTEYQAVPEGDFDPVEVTLAAGDESMEGNFSYKGDVSTLTDPRGYVVPLEITSVESTDNIGRVDAQRVFYAIIDISNLHSTVVDNPDELGTKVTDRSGYKILKFANANTGAEVTPATGGMSKDYMFTDNNAQYWVVQQSGIKLNITIDLGTEVQNISGLWLEGFQASASFNMKAVDVYYSTEQAYTIGQSNLAGKISLNAGKQLMYIKFSEPVNARYIMLNNMTPASVILALRQFYICTGN